MEILSTIKNITFPFIRNWSQFSTTGEATTTGTTGAIRGTSREKLYHESGFESLVSRGWHRKLVAFIKFSRLSHLGIYSTFFPTAKRAYITRNNDKLPHFKAKHSYLKKSFFPSTVIEWNKLDLNIRNSECLTSFKGKVLKFICPSENSTFLCNNPKGIKLLTRLRLGLSRLQDHKFKHTSEAPLIQFVIPVRILKLRATTFFTVHSIQMKD